MRTRNLKDKVVIISGSSRGIGKALAMEFIRRGAAVTINGRAPDQLNQTETELRSPGVRLLAVQGDVSSAGDAAKIVTETLKSFGRIDILVNGAGVSMRGRFEDLDPEVFHSVFMTNVIGSANLTIPAIKYIKVSKGSIVFISSIAGIRGLPGMSAYSSSKMALRGMAESLKIEEAGSGIHIGLILAGQTEVEKGKKILNSEGELISLDKHPYGRISSMESVVSATMYNIEHRKFISTLTMLGKLNSFVNTVAPGLGERILRRNEDQFLNSANTGNRNSV